MSGDGAIFALAPAGTTGIEARRIYAEGATAVLDWPQERSVFPRLLVELLALTDYRQARAIHDKMERAGRALRVQPNVELLPATRECGVVGSRQVKVHQPEQRAEEALGLSQRQIEDQAQRH